MDTGGAEEVLVIKTAAAATVEHPGLFRVKTDRTSANGAEFIAELLPPPESSHDTDEELLGERLRPAKDNKLNIILTMFALHKFANVSLRDVVRRHRRLQPENRSLHSLEKQHLQKKQFFC